MIDLTPLAWERAEEPAAGGEPQWVAIGPARPVAATIDGLLDRDDDPRLDARAWRYRLCFDAPAGHDRLAFDGLATLAEVRLNGETVLTTANMFRSYQVGVASLLRERGNVLEIGFAALDAALQARRGRPRWRVPMVRHAQLRAFRTTLLGRTPGWSPPLPVVGPWRPVRLLAAGEVDARDVCLLARMDGDDGVLTATAPAVIGAAARVLLRDADGAVVAEAPFVAGSAGATAALRVPHVRRWWPHTHGEPVLYAAELVFDAHGASQRVALGPVGFRDVRIVAGDDGAFALAVNGVAVFARGGCWMPLDALTLRADAAAYDAAVAQAREAGANLLRVPGNTIVEDDAFYAACDRAGVMVWQDLMFANLDYPADDPAFRAEVDAEVVEQLDRLGRHASLALVCGNSEVEQQAAMSGAPREAWSPPLFHEHLRDRVRERLGDGVPYWPSSSHGGEFPFQPSSGTSSYYGVGAYQRAVDEASTAGPRFATECLAFANIPDDATLARLGGGTAPAVHGARWKARSPRDLGVGWDFDDVREHYVERLYGLAPAAVRYGDPARHRRLGRAAVAEVMAEVYTRWRCPGSRCSGALVWFWRDLRAGAGWGVLDDQGAPKSAFHALRRVWQPRHLGFVDRGLDGLQLHLVNETSDVLRGTLELALYRHGAVRVAHGRRELTIDARGAWAGSAVALLDGFADLNWAYRFGPPMADVAVARFESGDGRIEAVRFLDAAGVRHPGDPGLEGTAEPMPDGRMRVLLSSRAAARAVWFEAEGWRPDDEYFDLAPQGRHEVVFTPLPGRTRTWRALAGALNQADPVTLPVRPATATP